MAEEDELEEGSGIFEDSDDFEDSLDEEEEADEDYPEDEDDDSFQDVMAPMMAPPQRRRQEPKAKPFSYDLRLGALPPEAYVQEQKPMVIIAVNETELDWTHSHRVGETSLRLLTEMSLCLDLPDTVLPGKSLPSFSITMDIMSNLADESDASTELVKGMLVLRSDGSLSLPGGDGGAETAELAGVQLRPSRWHRVVLAVRPKGDAVQVATYSWLVYGLLIESPSVIVANCISFSIILFIITFIILSKK